MKITKDLLRKMIVAEIVGKQQAASQQTFDKEARRRQRKDSKRYGRFMRKGREIQNRTERGRLKDTENLIEHLLKDVPNDSSIVIDIGSALGNSNPKRAGITVKELVDNSKISSKATIVGTDIPEQMERWNKLQGKYNINTYKVPANFMTPVGSIVKKYSKPTEDGIVILRSSNGIDLLMDENQAAGHFSHVASELKDKNVYYLYNKYVYYKSSGASTFTQIGNLHNRGFDHKGRDWRKKLKKGQSSFYLNIPDDQTQDIPDDLAPYYDDETQQTTTSKDEPINQTAIAQTVEPNSNNNTQMFGSGQAPRGYRFCKGVLKKGCGGNNVLEMQKSIVEFGKNNGLGDVLSPYEPDGEFGKKTLQAVKKIQKKLISMGHLPKTYGSYNRSSVDGIFGELTQDALNVALGQEKDYFSIREIFKRYL